MQVNFINLTNGIQAIKDYSLTDYRFIRLQSTACEQKRWEDILLTISDDFLMHVALGHTCIVYDYGANKQVPRAVWQGLEWVKYVLSLRWYQTEYVPVGRAEKGQVYFGEQYRGLSKRIKNRLDYFRKYLNGPINIQTVTGPTENDGKYSTFMEIMGVQRGAITLQEKV